MAKRKPLDPLAICALAAQAEGLSYGKYMVKYSYDPPCLWPFRDAYDAPEVKHCEICGKEIPKHRLRVNAKTCCPAHGEELNRRGSVERQRRIREEKKKGGAPTDQS